MDNLSLLAIPAFALAFAAFLLWDTRRTARLNERAVPAKTNSDK
ncbi:hypothetical protein [Gymnodinialimonas phycosphaerae]|nr:hypothetical protein [Gymnodinialimonas phycosphaerae]